MGYSRSLQWLNRSSSGSLSIRRLGDLLVAEGLLTDEQLKQALAEQKGTTEKIGSILIRLNYINEEQLIGFLSRQYGIPSITLPSSTSTPMC